MSELSVPGSSIRVQDAVANSKAIDVPPAVAAEKIDLISSTIKDDLRQALNGKVIGGLDALRALAVTLVLIEHFRLVPHGPGYLGVMIFFVLSGFLITSILLKEYRKTGSISFKNFYRRRAFRIFPTFYLCWILTTILLCMVHQFHWKPALVSFFYLMDYGRPFFSPALRENHMWISWSLAVEEKFYLCWPLLLLYLLKRPNTLIRNICLIIAGQWIYRAILYLVFHVRWGYIYCTFDMRADALLVGCLLAILLEQDKIAAIFFGWLRHQWLTAIPIGALTLLAIFQIRNHALALVFWTAQPLIIGILLVQFVYWGSKSWSFLRSAPVRFLAHISYALYLYHPLASGIIYWFVRRHVGYYGAPLALAMSTASYYWVEKPFMKMRDKGKRSWATAAPAKLASQ